MNTNLLVHKYTSYTHVRTHTQHTDTQGSYTWKPLLWVNACGLCLCKQRNVNNGGQFVCSLFIYFSYILYQIGIILP